jgi:type I restriction enzyme, S subunit
MSSEFRINSRWPVVPLSDVVFFQEGPGLRNWQYRDEGTPFVNIRCIKDGRLLREEMTCLDPVEVQQKYQHFLLNAGDFVVSSSGTLGRLAEVTAADLPCMLNTSVIRFRPITHDSLDRRYLRYFLSSSLFEQQILAFANGSAQLNYGPSHLKRMGVVVPPREIQIVIGEVLGSIDDRITLLRETNATLEAIAQALFKSWFVDFDPVRAKMEGRTPEGMYEATAALFPDALVESELGLVPEGWRVIPVGDAIDTVGGATPDTKNEAYWEPPTHYWTSPKDLSGITAPVLLNTERKISPQGLAKIGSGLLPVNTLLMSSRAPIGYLALTQVPLAINQGYIAMLPSGLLPPLYMYFWCRQNMDNIKGRANGSTFMEISKKAFRPIPALVPHSDLVKAFVEAAGVLFERLTENEKQAQTLTSIRDILLPRLISGQLHLPEAVAELETVA